MFTWEDCQKIIGNNELEKFNRNSEQTAVYHALKSQLEEENSSVFKHVLTNQLGWYNPDLNGNKNVSELQDSEIVVSIPNESDLTKPVFTNKDLIKILLNDFPYDFDTDITHFVVWYRGVIPVILPKGDVSDKTRGEMYEYVRKTFAEAHKIPESNILWFRNWLLIQSVKGINHIHVLVRGLSKVQVQDILS